jgi:hypothetical protein
MRFSFLLRAAASAVALSALQAPVHAQQITGISALTSRGEVPLESSVGVSQAKSGLLKSAFTGVNDNAQLVEVSGDRSSVRLRASDVQGFLAHVVEPAEMKDMSPEQLALPAIQNARQAFIVGSAQQPLRLLVVRKGKARQFVTLETKGVLVFNHVKDSSPLVVVNVTQYDEHTAKIVPKVLPLLPGEYAFMAEAVNDQPDQRYATPAGKVNLKDMGHYRMYCFAIE